MDFFQKLKYHSTVELRASWSNISGYQWKKRGLKNVFDEIDTKPRPELQISDPNTKPCPKASVMETSVHLVQLPPRALTASYTHPQKAFLILSLASPTSLNSLMLSNTTGHHWASRCRFTSTQLSEIPIRHLLFLILWKISPKFKNSHCKAAGRSTCSKPELPSVRTFLWCSRTVPCRKKLTT